MSAGQLVGLIECPHYNGWIEFEYASGDRLVDLFVSLEREWGKARSRPQHFDKSWALFYDNGDGTYIALKKGDRIPLRGAPPDAVDLPPDDYFASHAFAQSASDDDPYKGVLDVFFLREYWKVSENTPEEPNAHYVMRFSFERKYEIPTDKEYDCRLLALIAVVGG